MRKEGEGFNYGYLLLGLGTLIVFILIFSFDSSKYSEDHTVDKDYKDGKICFKQNCFDTEVVNTEIRRQRGLSFEDNMALDKGMLFIFDEEGQHPMWMKDMNFPLDMVWINDDSKIVAISAEVQPCGEGVCSTFSNSDPARYVLELNSGIVKELGLKLGDSVEII